MNLIDLFASLASRKAEVVIVSIIGICHLAGIADVDRQVIMYAMVIVGIIGLVGIIAQAIIDLKNPKQIDDAPAVSAVVMETAGDGPVEGANE